MATNGSGDPGQIFAAESCEVFWKLTMMVANARRLAGQMNPALPLGMINKKMNVENVSRRVAV